MIWEKVTGKFEFKLEISYEREKSFDEENKSMSILNIEELKSQKITLDKEKIYQHSSRAKLYIHSKKTNPSKQQKV